MNPIDVRGHSFDLVQRDGSIRCRYYRTDLEIRCEHRLIPDSKVPPDKVAPGNNASKIHPTTLAELASGGSLAREEKDTIPPCEVAMRR